VRASAGHSRHGTDDPSHPAPADRRLLERRQSGARILLASVLVIAVLYLAKPVVIPLALAILFAFLLRPVVAFFEKTFLRRTGAIILSLAITVGVLGVGAWALTLQFTSLLREATVYSVNIERKLQQLQTRSGYSFAIFERALQRIAQTGSDIEQPDFKVDVIERRSLAERYERIAPTAEALAAAFLVVVLVFFLLQESEKMRDRLLRLAGRANLTVTTQALGETTHRISRFLFTQALLNTGFGVIMGIGLFLMGLPHAILWGVLAGLLRFIPYIGAVIAALLPVALALAVFPDWYHPVAVLALFIVSDQLMAGFIEPLVIGRRVGVSPVALLTATIFWGWLWGPVGLLLATPITVCLTVAGEFVPALRVFSTLFGTEAPLEDYLSFYNRLIARDRSGAMALADRYAEENGIDEVFHDLFVPTLAFSSEELAIRRISLAHDHFIKDVIRELIVKLGDRNQTVGESHQRIVAVSAGGSRISLGTLMLIQLLRAEGYTADLFTDLPLDELLEYLGEARPEAVFVTCPTMRYFDEGLSLIAAIRLAIPDTPVVAGGSAFAENHERVLAAGGTFLAPSLARAKGDFLSRSKRAWRSA
jgi:predicted PurR-regulated permease PerM